MKSGTFAATAALISAVALQLTGCARDEPAQIVPDKAAELISGQVQSKSGFTPTDINCPSGIEATVGAQFACTFSGPSGKYAIRMKVTKVNGSYVEYDMSWRLTELADNGSAVTATTDTPTPAESSPADNNDVTPSPAPTGPTSGN
jgi:hypothetical protein